MGGILVLLIRCSSVYLRISSTYFWPLKIQINPEAKLMSGENKKAIVGKTPSEIVEYSVKFEPKRFNSLIYDNLFNLVISNQVLTNSRISYSIFICTVYSFYVFVWEYQI